LRRASNEDELTRLLAVAEIRPLTDARTVRRGRRHGVLRRRFGGGGRLLAGGRGEVGPGRGGGEVEGGEDATGRAGHGGTARVGGTAQLESLPAG